MLDKDFKYPEPGCRPMDAYRHVGGGVVTRDYFASGRYEARMKVAPGLGACSTMWTFWYDYD